MDKDKEGKGAVQDEPSLDDILAEFSGGQKKNAGDEDRRKNAPVGVDEGFLSGLLDSFNKGLGIKVEKEDIPAKSRPNSFDMFSPPYSSPDKGEESEKEEKQAPYSYDEDLDSPVSLDAFEAAYKSQKDENNRRRARIRRAFFVRRISHTMGLRLHEKPSDKWKARHSKLVTMHREKPGADPEAMLNKYKYLTGDLTIRIFAAIIPALLNIYLSIASQLMLPLPAAVSVTVNPRLHVYLQIAFLLFTMAAAAPVVAEGLFDLFKLKPDGKSLVSLSCVASILHALSLIFIPADGLWYLPYCVISSTALVFSLFGLRFVAAARMRSLRMAIKASKFSAVVLIKDGFGGRPSFFKLPGGKLSDFAASMEEKSNMDVFISMIAPVVISSAIIFPGVSAVANGNFAYFTWGFAAIMAASCCFGTFLAYNLPYALAARRLLRMGVAVGGSGGMGSLSRRATVVLSEKDVFPADSVKLHGCRMISALPKESAIAYTASVLSAANCAIADIFIREAAKEFATLRTVDSLSFHEGGGIEASIEGRKILVGPASFINRMGIVTPGNIKLKTAVFCAVDMQLAAVFALEYLPSSRARKSLVLLLRSRRPPVLASRDFNVTAELLEKSTGVPAYNIIFPSIDHRIALNNPDRIAQGNESALMLRDSVEGYVYTLESARRLSFVSKISMMVCCLSIVVGVLIMFFLTFLNAPIYISPLYTLFYMSIWIIPIIIISFFVKKF